MCAARQQFGFPAITAKATTVYADPTTRAACLNQLNADQTDCTTASQVLCAFTYGFVSIYISIKNSFYPRNLVWIYRAIRINCRVEAIRRRSTRVRK
jgi:hypothetical protein